MDEQMAQIFFLGKKETARVVNIKFSICVYVILCRHGK
jgi:hypothetical protein